MSNKNFSQFALQSSLQTTDHLVGYRSTSAGGELRTTVGSLANAVGSSLPGQPWACKAWLTATYRSAATGRFELTNPRLLGSYNISEFRGLANRRFAVFFTRPFVQRTYAVIGDSALTNNDKIFVAGQQYTVIPSEDLGEIGQSAAPTTAQTAWKTVNGCKFESTNAAYLTEFYIAFFGN
jgi:hypothetical protein